MSKVTCAQQMDGVHGLDVAGHVLDPFLQVIARVVGDVVVLGAIIGLALDNVQLCLGARLVHEIVAENGRVLPAHVQAKIKKSPLQTHVYSKI